MRTMMASQMRKITNSPCVAAGRDDQYSYTQPGSSLEEWSSGAGLLTPFKVMLMTLLQAGASAVVAGLFDEFDEVDEVDELEVVLDVESNVRAASGAGFGV
jgi:hypothetical protein